MRLSQSAHNTVDPGEGDEGVPENLSMDAALQTINNNYDPNTDLTTAKADYVKSSSLAVGKSGNVSYTWTKTRVEPNAVWYVRAYSVYTLNGAERTVYGPLVARTAE